MKLITAAFVLAVRFLTPAVAQKESFYRPITDRESNDDTFCTAVDEFGNKFPYRNPKKLVCPIFQILMKSMLYKSYLLMKVYLLSKIGYSN